MPTRIKVLRRFWRCLIFAGALLGGWGEGGFSSAYPIMAMEAEQNSSSGLRYLTPHFAEADNQNELGQFLLQQTPWPYWQSSAHDTQNLAQWWQDLEDYYQLKFVLAARLEILWRLWQAKLELTALGQSLAGEKINLPSLAKLLGRQGQKHLVGESTHRPFAAHLAFLQEERTRIANYYQKFNANHWARAIFLKALDAVTLDLEIYLWPHQNGPHGYDQYDGIWPRRDFIDQRPLTNHENPRLGLLRGRYQRLWQDRQFSLLARPYLTDLSWVRPWNFYLESKEPSYYFYQYLVAQAYAPYARDFMFLAHDKHNFYPATAAQIASKINLPAQVRDYKRAEVQGFFTDAARHLLLDLQQNRDKLFSPSLTKKALQELVANDLAAVEKSICQVLAVSTLAWDEPLSLFAHRQSIFREFAWMGELKELAFLVEASFPGGKNLDYLSNQRYLSNLQHLAWQEEKKAQHDWIGLGMMAAAMVTAFVPFGSWISPTLWAMAASYDLGLVAIPHYMATQTQLSFGQALQGGWLPRENNTAPELSFGPAEYLAKLQLAQQQKSELAISVLIDTPLLLLGSGRLVKNMRHHLSFTQILETEQASWRSWFSAQAYQTLYDQGWKAEDLAKLGRFQMLKLMAGEKLDFTMLVTFAGFGAAMLAMQIMDQRQAKALQESDDPTSPANPLALLELVPCAPSQPEKALHLIEALTYRFKKMGVLNHAFYLAEFSQIPASLEQAKFRFYEGEQIVLLFDTVYLPLKVLDRVNVDYTFDDLVLAVAEKIILEHLLESALISAVLQKVEGDFWQEVWHRSNLEENGRRFFGQNLLFAAQHLLEQNWSDFAQQAPARASKLAQLYRSQVAQLSLEEGTP